MLTNVLIIIMLMVIATINIHMAIGLDAMISETKLTFKRLEEEVLRENSLRDSIYKSISAEAGLDNNLADAKLATTIGQFINLIDK